MSRTTSDWFKAFALRGGVIIMALVATQSWAATVFSCKYEEILCVDYSFSFDVPTPPASYCGDYLYSVATCPATNQTATCTLTYGSGGYSGSLVMRFYSGYEDAQQACSMAGGVFSGAGAPSPTTPLPPPPTTQAVYAVPNGQLPTEAVRVDATGTYGRATVKVNLDFSQAVRNFSTNRDAAGYNVYVVAIVPGSIVQAATPLLVVKAEAPRSWEALGWPIASYLTNANLSADQVLVDIIDGMDITWLVGTEIYLGYGTSGDEMLAARRYRGVYKIQ